MIPTTLVNVSLKSINDWLIIQSRINSSFPTALNWATYKVGFGSTIESNFWLGLEKIYQLTKNNGKLYQLRVEVLSSTNNR